MAIRLTPKAYGALRLVKDTSFKQRARKLESFGEQGFALILYWNQIEIALKLIRYGYSIKDGWPDSLNFLGTTWKTAQNLKIDAPLNYELVLGKSSNSLWKTRDKIVHEGYKVPDDEYHKYVEVALWAIMKLMQEIPNLERLRERKRHSDARAARIIK